MADFSKIEDRLNKDQETQKEFLKNPVEVLQREGLDLNPDMQKQLRSLVRQAGSAPRLLAAKPKIGISISIRIRF